MPEYKKIIKLREFIDSLEAIESWIRTDANSLTTGNLAHHKPSILSHAKHLKREIKDIKPLMEEIREMFLNRSEPGKPC